MKIRVLNCKDDDIRNEFRRITEYALNRLLKGKRKLLRYTSITIKIDDEETKKEKAWGLCYWADRRHNPRKYVILLNSKQSRKKLLEVLVHEIVHVKQYLVGDLKDYHSGIVRWKKKRYEDLQEYEMYVNTPWEKQAYTLSKIIFKRYLELYGN